MKTLKKVVARQRRHARVRKRVSGTADCPRLAVFRSNRHIYAQLIDDLGGRTLAAASSLDAELSLKDRGGNADAAKAVGELLGRRAQQAGIQSAVFDRGGYQFAGRVRRVAEGARETGLKV